MRSSVPSSRLTMRRRRSYSGRPPDDAVLSFQPTHTGDHVGLRGRRHALQETQDLVALEPVTPALITSTPRAASSSPSACG